MYGAEKMNLEKFVEKNAPRNRIALLVIVDIFLIALSGLYNDSNTKNKVVKTANITIKDKAGNSNSCSMNVYEMCIRDRFMEHLLRICVDCKLNSSVKSMV